MIVDLNRIGGISFALSMWRIIPILILVVSVCGHSFRLTGTLARFNLNQTEIAQTLCVKKEVKGNTCQGKCHLKKMM